MTWLTRRLTTRVISSWATGRATSGLAAAHVVVPHTVAAILLAVTTATSAHAKDFSAAFRHQQNQQTAPSPKITQAQTNLPEVFDKPAPTSVQDLNHLQAHIHELTQRLHACTVAIITGDATGSGVIISQDGYVLTAGHVFETPNRSLTFIFPDGSTAKGVSLGHNSKIDSGLCRITDQAPNQTIGWPHAPIGELTDTQVGDYVLAIGHPGGYDADRPYVARLGRLIAIRDDVLQTDATVVGGDSGGPLFDMSGRVIGIHSRINLSVNGNFHIPITTYLETWDKLAQADRWGSSFLPSRSNRARLGIQGRDATGLNGKKTQGAVIQSVTPGSAAAQGGLLAGDIIVGFNQRVVTDYDNLARLVSMSQPGQAVEVQIIRGDEPIILQVTLGGAQPQQTEPSQPSQPSDPQTPTPSPPAQPNQEDGQNSNRTDTPQTDD